MMMMQGRPSSTAHEMPPQKQEQSPSIAIGLQERRGGGDESESEDHHHALAKQKEKDILLAKAEEEMVEEATIYPDDIICEILERVDPNSLFQCGLVCRQWKALCENEYFQRGKRCEKKCDFSGACKYYTAAICLNPDFRKAYNRRGNAKYSRGDRKAAEEDWLRAVEGADEEEDAQEAEGDKAESYHALSLTEKKVVRSKILVLQGDMEGALKQANEAIQSDPQNPDAYHQRGFVRSFTEDVMGEIEDFSTCIELKRKLNPFDSYSAYNNRGLAYHDLEHWDKAIADHTEALRLQPNYSVAYKHRGKAYRCLGDLTKAIQDLTAAIQINSDDVDALVERAYTFYESAQPNKSLEDCEAAIALDPLCHEAHTIKAGIMADNNNLDEAITILNDLLDRSPDAFAFRFRGELRYMKGDVEGAKGDFRSSLSLEPRDPEVLELVAVLDNAL
ncbi:Tetratricopeptide repeat domain containing protein [Balamuthia mandrillaris]